MNISRLLLTQKHLLSALMEESYEKIARRKGTFAHFCLILMMMLTIQGRFWIPIQLDGHNMFSMFTKN